MKARISSTDLDGIIVMNAALILSSAKWWMRNTRTAKHALSVYTWLPRLWRAMRYARISRHRYSRLRVDPKKMYRPAVFKLEDRYIGKRRAPRGYVPLTPEDLEPFLPADPTINPWQDKTHGKTILGSGTHAAGTGDSAEKPVFPRKSGIGDHRRYLPALPRRRVQWAAEGLQARIESVFDLVSEGMPDYRHRDRYARP